jgi:hypothetical protein
MKEKLKRNIEKNKKMNRGSRDIIDAVQSPGRLFPLGAP